MLNFGASKPRVKGGPGPQTPPGSVPDLSHAIPEKQVYLISLRKVQKILQF